MNGRSLWKKHFRHPVGEWDPGEIWYDNLDTAIERHDDHLPPLQNNKNVVMWYS